MKTLSCLAWLLIALPAVSEAQVLRHEYLAYEFDTAGFGYDTPEELGRAFFTELQGGRDLKKFFGTLEVFKYMIVHAGKQHENTAMATAEFYWKDFEAQRETYCRQLFDNLDHLGNMQDAVLNDVRYDVEKIQASDVLASDIELIFTYGKQDYGILLDDCGKVRGKWFLMTPFVLWQGVVPPPADPAPDR